MKEFDFHDPRAFIHPGAIAPFLAAFGAYRARGEQVVLRHLGVSTLDASPTARYPFTAYMAAVRELQGQFGTSFMRKIGTLILANAAFPPGLDSAEKVLTSLNQAYFMNHDIGGADIGHYRWVSSGPKKGSMVCDNPYPCAMDLGLLESIVSRFEPATGKVTHAPGSCRHDGDDVCTYLVEW